MSDKTDSPKGRAITSLADYRNALIEKKAREDWEKMITKFRDFIGAITAARLNKEGGQRQFLNHERSWIAHAINGAYLALLTPPNEADLRARETYIKTVLHLLALENFEIHDDNARLWLRLEVILHSLVARMNREPYEIIVPEERVQPCHRRKIIPMEDALNEAITLIRAARTGGKKEYAKINENREIIGQLVRILLPPETEQLLRKLTKEAFLMTEEESNQGLWSLAEEILVIKLIKQLKTQG